MFMSVLHCADIRIASQISSCYLDLFQHLGLDLSQLSYGPKCIRQREVLRRLWQACYPKMHTERALCVCHSELIVLIQAVLDSLWSSRIPIPTANLATHEQQACSFYVHAQLQAHK